MRLAMLTIGTLVSLVLVSGAPGADSIEAARKAAERAASALGKTLVAELSAALAEGGPVSAIEVCSAKAQPLTADLAKEHGLSIRRTALRLRNPENAPDAVERAWLERAAAAVAEGKTPEPSAEVATTDDGSRELRVLRPILFPGAPCATCHGAAEEIPADVRAILAERYPDDRAVGFRPGDLRGAFSVRVPLP